MSIFYECPYDGFMFLTLDDWRIKTYYHCPKCFKDYVWDIAEQALKEIEVV